MVRVTAARHLARSRRGEPESALDPDLVAEVVDVIRELELAPPADLFGNPRQERTQRFLRRVTDAGRL
jgi:ABC-type arginine transport system ATPase subunit